jgi:hypothetical protein
LSDISYSDAVRAIMRKHKVDERTAELMVADIYPALSAFDREAEPAIAFDHPDEVVMEGVYHPPVQAGKVVPIDDEPSPAWAIEAQKARTAAEVEGDRYRALSRRTSFHSVDD